MNIQKLIKTNIFIKNKLNKYEKKIKKYKIYFENDNYFNNLINNKNKINSNCIDISDDIDNYINNIDNNIDNNIYENINNSLIYIKNELNEFNTNLNKNKFIKFINIEKFDIGGFVSNTYNSAKNETKKVLHELDKLKDFLLNGIINFVKNKLGDVKSGILKGITFISNIIIDIFKPIISVFEKILNFFKIYKDDFDNFSNNIFEIIKNVYDYAIKKIFPIIKISILLLIKYFPLYIINFYKYNLIFFKNLIKLYLITPTIFFTLVIFIQIYFKLLLDSNSINPYFYLIGCFIFISYNILFNFDLLLDYQNKEIELFKKLISLVEQNKYLNKIYNNNIYNLIIIIILFSFIIKLIINYITYKFLKI